MDPRTFVPDTSAANSERPAAQTSAPTCPHDGSTMIANPALPARDIVKQMTSAGSNSAYAQNFADSHREKEAAEGVVYVCPTCRYVTRGKGEA